MHLLAFGYSWKEYLHDTNGLFNREIIKQQTNSNFVSIDCVKNKYSVDAYPSLITPDLSLYPFSIQTRSSLQHCPYDPSLGCWM